MLQVAFAASMDPQELAPVAIAKTLELVPPSAMLPIANVAFPVFERVTVCVALVVPEPAVKVSVPGVKEATGAGGVVPAPVRKAVWGEPLALSSIDSVAEKLATDAGVKVTKMLQRLPAASVDPQELGLSSIAKSLGSAPVIDALMFVSAAVPVFESVNTPGVAVVFSVTLVKLKLAGASNATGAATIPVPVNDEV